MNHDPFHRKLGVMERTRGFTLIELLVAVAVASILLAVALPSFQSLIASNRSASDANALLSILMLTRSEAIKRNTTVVACKSTDGESCSTDSSVGWDAGVVVFVDNVATNNKIDSGETIVQVRVPLARVSEMTGNAQVENSMSYLPTGRGTKNGTITIDPNDSAHARRLVISPAGRPYITKS
ncbi:GspH/FimT family pseudopilin [uncultured Abyssibacter sp.]|uniref:GspH/FimT family pseudopilin n=1 Tax=uncultured Abyssibacter sp. TaxID=2320202 RepID=UPI0032B280E6